MTIVSTTPKPNCPQDEMFLWECDGEEDCYGGEDEQNCTFTGIKFFNIN